MIVRIAIVLVTGTVVVLLPDIAQAGFCTSLPDCGGGSVPFAQACTTAIGTVAAACLPTPGSGEWHEGTDDLGDSVGNDSR